MSATISREADNVYLNVVMNHSGGITNETPTIASYNVQKTNPIIDKPSDYYCSIIRFEIPLDDVPLAIMPIVPNQANPNLSTLKIGIEASSVDYTQTVIYEPDDALDAPVPVQNQTFQVITPYYFIYEYNNLVAMVNVALSNAWIAAGSPGGAGNCPFFFWNTDTQLFEFYVSNAFIASGADVYFNESMRNYFDTFRIQFLGYNQPNGHDYEIVIRNATTNAQYYKPYLVKESIAAATLFPYDPIPAGAWFKFAQEYSSIAYWQALRKILIISTTLPIVSEIVPGQNAGTKTQNGVSTSFPIVSDFVPQVELVSQSRSIAYYVPTSQYKLIDMTSDTPLSSIDLKVLWQDKQGNNYPIYITSEQQISIKLAFLKKSLYKPANTLISK